jgi:hypothetical protein
LKGRGRGDLHQLLELLTELGGDKPHPVGQVAGELLGLPLGGLANRGRAGSIGVERDGAQGNDGQQEERNDQTQAQRHRRRVLGKGSGEY